METLLLHEKHSMHKATFEALDGYQVPFVYGDVVDEYRAATQAAALYDRSSRGILRFYGPDRESWLHGMTTNDLRSLSLGQGQRTMVCSVKGKVLGLGVITKLDDCIQFDVDPLCRQKTHETLEKFLITEDMTIEDETDRTAVLSVVGPDALSFWEEFQKNHGSKNTLESKNTRGSLDTLWSYQEHLFEGERLGLRRSRLGEVPALDIFAPQKIAGHLFEALLTGLSGNLLGARAAEIIRIEGGEVRYGWDIDENIIPQEADLEEAISYTKGCYLGQETIARLHYRGHVNRHLRGFVFVDKEAPIPERGTKIQVEGAEKGFVTSACRSIRLGVPVALGYLRREFATPGTRVTLGEDGFEAKVTELPFRG